MARCTGPVVAPIEAELPPYEELVFAGVVSLGGNCETAHWLRACGRHAIRTPFDWLVTPLDAVSSILNDDAARIATSFALAQNGTSVRCGVYDVLYHHEFQRGCGNAVIFDAASIDTCRSKMAHKWSSFVSACETAVERSLPLLFIRVWGGTDLTWDRIGAGKAAPRFDDFNNVAAALQRRFPKLDFRVLVLLPQAPPGVPQDAVLGDEALDPRVCIRSIGRAPNTGWATSGTSWSELLSKLHFTDPPFRTGLDETLYWSGEADEPR